MATSGVVRAISGQVRIITTDGSERILRLGDRVMSDDVIVTGDNGAISIELNDGRNFDMGRDSTARIDTDAADSSVADADLQSASAQQEVEAIQQALVDDPDFDPTQLPPAAAGPAAAGGAADDNGHSVVSVDYLEPQMTPESGFETTGIGVVFPELYEDFILNPVQPVSVSDDAFSGTVLAENSELDETSGRQGFTGGSLRVNDAAPVTVVLSAPGATWSPDSNTLTSENYSIAVDSNGNYIFSLLKALQHPQGAGSDNFVDLTISAQLTDAEGNTALTTFAVKVYDDGPTVDNYDGSLNNEVGETLAGLIDYDLGFDGLGSVTFGTVDSEPDLLTVRYNGDEWSLTSRGDKLSYVVTDADSDNLQEIQGFVDRQPEGWQGENIDRPVFTLKPTASGVSDDDYELVLHDVLDMPVVSTQVSFADAVQTDGGAVIAHSESTQNSTEVLIEGLSGNPVLENGFVGIGDNVLQTGEQISYKFGDVASSGTLINPSIVNDVELFQVNNPLGGDAVIWTAKKAGDVVGSSTFIFTAPEDGSVASSPAIHVDGGYDTLEITAIGGFQVSGLSYVNQTATNELSLDILFGFNATDGDSDTVSGEFTVSVGNSNGTVLGDPLSLPTPHEDSFLINNLDVPVTGDV